MEVKDVIILIQKEIIELQKENATGSYRGATERANKIAIQELSTLLEFIEEELETC